MDSGRHILVVGAGDAGVRAANRIAAAPIPGTTATVVNPRAVPHAHAVGVREGAERLRTALLRAGHAARQPIPTEPARV